MSKEFSIEDIFSKADFKKYYLLENEKFYDDKKTNAQIAKEKNSKFLDSKILRPYLEKNSVQIKYGKSDTSSFNKKKKIKPIIFIQKEIVRYFFLTIALFLVLAIMTGKRP